MPIALRGISQISRRAQGNERFIAAQTWGCKRADHMDLRCPKCNSTDLKKVSPTYEGRAFRTEAQTRVRAAVTGGTGADLIIRGASTSASRQLALSKRQNPPVKWSYRKVFFWNALVFVCGAWLVFYVNTVTKNATTVTSPALTAYALIAVVIFGFVLAVVVSHNHSVYPKRFGEWDRAFICQRCGTITRPKTN